MKEGAQRLESRSFVCAVGTDRDFVTALCSQRHDGKNGFCVDAFVAFGETDGTRKQIGGSGDKRPRTGVQAELIDDGKVTGLHDAAGATEGAHTAKD